MQKASQNVSFDMVVQRMRSFLLHKLVLNNLLQAETYSSLHNLFAELYPGDDFLPFTFIHIFKYVIE